MNGQLGRITVSFACNHPDNGFDLGKFDACEIEDLRFVCTLMGGGTTLKNLGSSVRVGRLVLPHRGYKYGHGNWCWDAYVFEPMSALAIVNYLGKSEHWHCEKGAAAAYEKFNAERKLTLAELQEAIAND